MFRKGAQVTLRFLSDLDTIREVAEAFNKHLQAQSVKFQLNDSPEPA